MNPQLQREVITDLAPHPFDICNYILDMWAENVSCKARGYRTRQNEEVAFITAEHNGGLLAHIELSWLDRNKQRTVTVVGSKGNAYLDCITQKLSLEKSNVLEDVPVFPSNTLREEITHFANCIHTNHDPTPPTNCSDGILGARVVALLEASRESMVRDRPVRPVYIVEAPRTK